MCVSGKVVLWSKHFYIIILVPMLYLNLKLHKYIYIYIYIFMCVGKSNNNYNPVPGAAGGSTKKWFQQSASRHSGVGEK